MILPAEQVPFYGESYDAFLRRTTVAPEAQPMRPETRALLEQGAANGGIIADLASVPPEASLEAQQRGWLDWPDQDGDDLRINAAGLAALQKT